MLKSANHKKRKRGSRKSESSRYKRLVSMGKMSKGIIDELYSPIDSINRFINLTLNDIDEGSQGRQFLLESKQGIRKTSGLLEKLNNYAKKIEREIREISERDEEAPHSYSKR